MKNKTPHLVGSSGARRAAQRRSSTAQLQKQVDDHLQAAMLLRPDGDIIYTNAHLEQLFGYGPEGLNGQPVHLLQPEHLGAGSLITLLHQFTHTLHRFKTMGLRKNHLAIRLEIDVERVRTPKGPLFYCSVSTPQHQETLAAPALAAAVELPWHAMIRDLPLSLLAIDPQGMILTASHCACLMFGYGTEELIGKPLLALHDPEQLEYRAREAAAQSGKTATASFAAMLACNVRPPAEAQRWTLLRKDGSKLEVGLSVTAVHDEFGTLSGYLALVRLEAEGERTSSLETQAHYDALTGLPNRILLADRIDVALH